MANEADRAYLIAGGDIVKRGGKQYFSTFPLPSPMSPSLSRQLMSNSLSLMTASSALGGSGGSTGLSAVRHSSFNALMPDPKQPDTLGWREWRWTGSMLVSPSMGTPWPEAELVVPHWDEGAAVRGASGIHAHLVPRHWKILGMHSGGYVGQGDPTRVHGIVERFGKYVLGTEGWRAEWVVIKELMAPSTEVGLGLEQAYPDVIVHYPDEEGDETCISEKSSGRGKGSRPTNRPRPSPSPPSPSSSPASPPLTPMQPLLLSRPKSENSSLLSRDEKKFLFSFILFCVALMLLNWVPS